MSAFLYESQAIMNLQNFKTLDPNILYSMVNMALRDYGDNLEGFCATQNIDINELKEVLANAGYTYYEDINQFR